MPHNHPYKSIIIDAIACNLGLQVTCVGMVWDNGTLFLSVAHGAVVATLYNPYLVCFYHSYIFLISLEIFFCFTCRRVISKNVQVPV